ncbi:hypothetical protein LSUE1_G005179 [Lachnellula suecica]|uniref:Stress-response A/B barrel domain-containing protein n=1 Tax=Lachnellula suecica TaxID=602035 RepID=A0A8T9C4D9_9HELO|nr:hypothetical protein LSUE1_G005179 [Lachnellula suecica]
MPYLLVVAPTIPEDHKEKFLAAWPQIVEQIKGVPKVLGVSAGPVIGEDGEKPKDFKFIQTIAFATLEDAESFQKSDWAVESKKKFEEAAKAQGLDATMPPHTVFETGPFPEQTALPAYTQMSRISVSDESKADELKGAWDAFMKVIGKEAWGGKSVGGDKTYGIGLVGWDSIQDVQAALSKPDAKAAYEKCKAMGDSKDALIQLVQY